MCFVFPADVVVLPGPSCDTPVTGVAGQELEQTLGEVPGALGWGKGWGLSRCLSCPENFTKDISV